MNCERHNSPKSWYASEFPVFTRKVAVVMKLFKFLTHDEDHRALPDDLSCSKS